LPEVKSTHEVLKVPSVSARFGTYPQIWNIAMGMVASLVPKVILYFMEVLLFEGALGTEQLARCVFRKSVSLI